VGVNLLELVVEALATTLGRWLVVAFIALLSIAVGCGFGRWNRS